MKKVVFVIITLLLLSACYKTVEPATKQIVEKVEKPEPLKVYDCSNFWFNNPPLAIENLEFIEPMGMMSGSHVTPVDHQYWYPKGAFKQNYESYEVVAPADGIITHIGHFTKSVSEEEYPIDDYRIVIEHPCDIQTIYIHLLDVPEEILSKVNWKGSGYEYASVKIPVKAGEVIGRVEGKSFDFSVHDYNIFLDGFISPEFYHSEEWKIHTVDPFEYFNEAVKQKLLDKNPRKKEPFGGKIDYDIQGKLVGNWFKKNTKGYQGTNKERYWDGHLTIAYDHYDSSNIKISIGDYEGKSRQFAVKGNSPNPKNIDIYTGNIKYELVEYDYYSNAGKWNRISYAEGIHAKNSEEIIGVIMFKVLEKNSLQMEIFPRKTKDKVSYFSSAHRIYER